MTKNRFTNIGAIIINSKEELDLDLIEKNRKRMYKKILKGEKDTKKDLNVKKGSAYNKRREPLGMLSMIG